MVQLIFYVIRLLVPKFFALPTISLKLVFAVLFNFQAFRIF